MISAFTFAAGIVAGCGDDTVEISSAWHDDVISIDGVNSEWDGHTVFMEDVDIVVGVVNDYDYLYVSLITSERTRQMQLLRGAILWFDPSGDRQKTFGVRFPLVMDDMSRMASRREDGERPTFEEFQEETTELEILGAAGPVARMPVDDSDGIEVSLGRSSTVVVYEIKVPLKADGLHEFAIGARPGESIQIGLETLELERPSGMGGGKGGGRGMGGGGGVGGGRPPGDGRGSFEPPEPIKAWVIVHLASPTKSDT